MAAPLPYCAGFIVRLGVTVHKTFIVRFPGAGSGKQDDPSSTQTVSGSGKDNLTRTSLDDGESTIVPERGEPEGESKQPVTVVTAQRQVT